jgi:NAD(P)-dependent dehydrogenase (short-subunit alcohol dehydrogenase family)
MLKNKVLLITGAGSGIGEAAARVFAGHGATLLVSDIDAESAGAVASRIVAAGGEAIATKVDVTNESEVAAMVELAVSRFGRLDGAFNNAGVGCP